MSLRDSFEPYGSANDLPSMQEMAQQIYALKLLSDLAPQASLNELEELENQRNHITSQVDAFYALLGAKNWVFTGDLNLTAIQPVTAASDAQLAESRLIAYYQEDGRLELVLRRLHRFEAMKPRMVLLEKALQDYREERYYSSVLVILAVMDGFVNDLDQDTRQGLHARPAEGMVAWDSVVGHHLGLSHAHKSFTKGFYKTDTSEVQDLSRNGIMHGVLVNFDNKVVATKAWNRLFAVTDWADARIRQAQPGEPQLQMDELLSQWEDIQDEKQKLANWKPYSCLTGKRESDECQVAKTCTDFLEKWQARQWALVGAHFMQHGQRESIGKLAELAKDLYLNEMLSAWSVRIVEHVAAAVAVVEVSLDVNDKTHAAQLRWVRTDETGSSVSEWSQGRWTLALYGPSLFLSV